MFDKLIQVPVFGCGDRRIADATCSATTLRRRRDEWIRAGVAERLRLLALAAYQRLFGLELKQLVHLLTDSRQAPSRPAVKWMVPADEKLKDRLVRCACSAF